ncbi:hypothetical protein CHELA20_51948 [Hyphomicrobiales bacterium]|nr:hypothetical protein CHELA41_22980 [Hyphomicrobiales bacterium]CAH1679633.1 hypothetical protein CHELA20_51948 [Hyphomicrobiales bacterium]
MVRRSITPYEQYFPDGREEARAKPILAL